MESSVHVWSEAGKCTAARGLEALGLWAGSNVGDRTGWLL
jgi:hypothetical protein